MILAVKKFWLITCVAFGMAIIVVTLVRVTTDSVEPEYQGRPLTGWMADLRSSSPLAQTNAALAIRLIGTNAVPFLVQMLDAKDSAIKEKCIDLLAHQRWMHFQFRHAFQEHRDALEALGILGLASQAAIPDIARHLDDANDTRLAAYTLYRCGTKAIPALNQALKNPNEDVRAYAVEMLGLLHDPQSVSNLLAMVNDPAFAVGSGAVNALAQFSGQARLIVPVLMAYLDSPDADFRKNTARTLAKFGEAAKPAMPKLLKMVGSADTEEGEVVAKVLMSLDFSGTLAAFTSDLSSPDVSVRRGTAWVLMMYSSDGKPAVPALVKCLKDPDIQVRENAAIALREIGAEPELVVPALIDNLTGPDLTLRSITAIALRSFGARAKAAVPKILQLIKENQGNEPVVKSLYSALVEIDPEEAAKLTNPDTATS